MGGLMFIRSEDLLITDRSHEDHGTKLTNVISKFMS
jgi:hypothetical protein